MTTTTKKRNRTPKHENLDDDEKKKKLNQGVGIGVGTTSAVLVLVGGKYHLPYTQKYSSDLISLLAGMAKLLLNFTSFLDMLYCS